MKAALVFATCSFVFLGYLMVTRGGVAPTPDALTRVSADDIETAVEMAREQDRVVVAIATADWCPPCQTYKRNALVDERVERWMRENAVAVIVDTTDRQAPNPDAAALGVRSIPATYVINADAQIVTHATGALTADDLLTMLDTATN
ncbi:MAG: thioredoxin family protein [Planctomycetota bacterium]